MAGEDVPGRASPEPPHGPPPRRHDLPPDNKKPRGRGRLTAIAVAVGVLVVLSIGVLVATDSRLQSECGLEDSVRGAGANAAVRRKSRSLRADLPPTIGVVYVQGEADNTSSERSDYTIEVAVRISQGTSGIGTGTASVRGTSSRIRMRSGARPPTHPKRTGSRARHVRSWTSSEPRSVYVILGAAKPYRAQPVRGGGRQHLRPSSRCELGSKCVRRHASSSRVGSHAVRAMPATSPRRHMWQRGPGAVHAKSSRVLNRRVPGGSDG